MIVELRENPHEISSLTNNQANCDRCDYIADQIAKRWQHKVNNCNDQQNNHRQTVKKRIQNFSQQKIRVGPTENFFRRADVSKLPRLLRVVGVNSFVEAIMSLLEVVIEKRSCALREKLLDFFISFVLVRLLIRHAMVLNVMSEFSIRKQEQIIVILKSKFETVNVKVDTG